MNHHFHLILSLIFPRRCPICDEPLPLSDELSCQSCFHLIPSLQSPLCMKCGRALSNSDSLYCSSCVKNPPSFDRGFSLWNYQNPAVKGSIHFFKYKGREEYANFYAFKLFYAFPFLFRAPEISALIPVPIHKKRYRIRGYNQAESIANKLSELSGIPVISDLLIRIKNTLPQSKLTDKERKINLKSAFLINPNSPFYNRHLDAVILIDDIYTTGATGDICSSLLKEAGISKVYFLSLSSLQSESFR